MAKAAMLKVDIFAHRSFRKPLLEYLQRREIIDIAEEECREGFSRQNTESPSSGFRRNAEDAERALTVIDEYAPEKRGMLDSFRGRREITPEEFEKDAGNSGEIVRLCGEIENDYREIAEKRAEIARNNALIPQYETYAELDLPLSFSGTETTSAFTGTFASEYTLPRLTEAVAEKFAREFYIEPVKISTEQTVVFALCLNRDAEEFERALRSLGFSRSTLISSDTAGERIENLRRETTRLENEIKHLEEHIASFAARRREIEQAEDYFTARAEKYETIGKLDQTENVFAVTGYVTAEDYDPLKRDLEEKFSAVVEAEKADTDDTPVKLRNNVFTAPASGITEMYSMPSRSDIDPTPVMSFFYYLFFGLMLSDAGYGLILILGSLFLIKKFKPEEKMRRNLMLFVYCGISTCFWGVMFGSYFGNAIPVISEALTGRAINIPPVLFDPMAGSSAVTLLVMSLAFGMCQIITGLAANLYNIWRGGDPWEAILGSGSWIIILLGIVAAIPGFMSFPALKPVAVVMAGTGVVMLFANGIRKKGFKGIFSGLASLYDITGYASDLMSFSRLMALGLTTAAMSQVFNQLSTLGGRSVPGMLVMFVIFVAGHLINFGLNALGAYVHTLRLQYVELFSKFYEGGGRPFRPFSNKGKYTKIKEDD